MRADAIVAGRVGASSGARGERAGRRPVSRLTPSPHRRYHTREHIAEVLTDVDRLLASREVGGRRMPTRCGWPPGTTMRSMTRRPSAGVNEDASAELARPASSVGRGPQGRAEVARLVRLTAEPRGRSDDLSGAVLVGRPVDLGFDPDRYDELCTPMYGPSTPFVDDEAWRTGRAAAVLRRFLDVAVVSRRSRTRAREQAAKVNLARSCLLGLRVPSLRRPGGRRGRPASRRRRTVLGD